MDSDDNQIERLYQLLLELQSNCEKLVNTFNALELLADHEFYKTNKSPDFIIDCMKKGKIVTNDIGRA
jgi:capsule polysaccharide export protein KpsC/LpsZ